MSKRRRKKDFVDSLAADFQRQQAQIYKSMLATQGPAAARAQKDPAPMPAEPPPVFSECVIGYRVWLIDALGRLRPQSVNQRPWLPGENTAVCDAQHSGMGFYSSQLMIGSGMYTPPAPPDHKAPAKNCQCGFYARFAPTDIPALDYSLDRGTWLVAGSTAGWGDMQVHADGMRSEKACVTALAVTDDMPAEIRALVERVAETYRVPAVPLASLSDEALLHGCPLPFEHRPKKPDRIDYFQQLYGSYSKIVSPSFYVTTNKANY